MSVFDRLTALQIVALTIYGEARGESPLGRLAVGLVIRNRHHDGRWTKSYHAVCLWPKQFSCWTPGSANHDHLMEVAEKVAFGTWPNQAYAECYKVAEAVVLCDVVEDIVKGATHYYAFNKVSLPFWARGHEPVSEIGGHRFYVGIA